jgi:hypothetical protein
MLVRRLFLLLTTILAVLTLACGGGGNGGEEAPADDTAREITDAELSQMVLQLVDFGPEFSGFSADSGNGPTNLESASQDDFDPAAERADLEKFGFTSAHEVYFSTTNPTDGGTFFLGSQTAMFQTADGADGYFQDNEAEIVEDVGKTSDGVTLVEAQKFDLNINGGQSQAVRGIASFADEDGTPNDVWIVVAEYRRGRLLGSVAIYTFAPSDLEKARLEGIVGSLASRMNDRMATVLAATAPTAAPAAAGQ